MKTIKMKLFGIFLVSMIAFVFCNILLNTVFLEKYYIYKNKDVLRNASQRIREEYKNNHNEEIEAMLKEIDRLEGINITISDRNMILRYSSFSQTPSSPPGRVPGEIEKILRVNEKRNPQTNIYTIVVTPDYNVREVVFINRLNNGDVLVLRKQMKAISESTAIANQFFILTGLIIVIIGGIFVYLFSRRLTRPIIEMSNIAEDISNLDFSRRMEYNSRDEIGSLARSINLISQKLSTSIKAL
ncbi:MAG: hypothetical protein CVU87_12285 [Firmicutes bacterium HGW-Firmicutes-12]|nr:MAG: hypothetical protein CVU87_12285 [Firmicutes bacterium HGW-Firmicutes-12]